MSSSENTQSQPPSARARWAVGIGFIVLLGLGYGWLKWSRPTPDVSSDDQADTDPRRTAKTPFRNVHPDVAYVGDAACALCHEKIAESFHRHPMGRSLQPVAEVAGERNYTPKAGNPFDAVGSQFLVERRGQQVFHREITRGPNQRPIVETETEVSYSIGSGAHAISYLINHNGSLTHSPITWYSQKQIWDLSPGFETVRDHFERPAVPGCLFCHSNRVEPVPDTVHSYRQPIFQGHTIGCERCHGPGALHVQSRAESAGITGVDYTIVNPAHLDRDLAESVCSQCHLGGKERVLRRGRDLFDFRPGLPLDQFLRVFVEPSEAQVGRITGHVEQMHISKCFQKSAGNLSCVSCHDPHALPAPEVKESYYRDRCLKCHETRGCTEPIARRREKTLGDDCTVCHMPREASNVNHMPLTDHRLPRRAAASANKNEPVVLTATTSLVPFGRNRLDRSDGELMRDLAIGVVNRGRAQSESFRAEVARDFVVVLRRAVQAHPNDVAAREALGIALAWSGDADRALAEMDATLERAPGREMVLHDAGLTARKAGYVDRSLGYWQRALAINPSSSRFRFEVANLLFQTGERDRASAECQRILAQYGGHCNTRLLLVQIYLKEGKTAEAREQLEAALALHPPNEAELRVRFAEMLR